jgi:hypothetical protein
MADDELVDYDEAEEPEVEAAKVSLRTGHFLHLRNSVPFLIFSYIRVVPYCPSH